MKNFIIRKAVKKDVNYILKLFAKSDRELTKVKITKNYSKNMKIIINNHLNKRNAFFCVAENKGQIVGYMFGFLKKAYPLDKKFTQVRLEDIYILPQERKKGIAKEFLREFYSWAKSKGINKIHLYTNINNKKSLSFWGKQKFKETGKTMTKKLK